MSKQNGPLPVLVASVLVVALLATLVERGWVLWVPALFALIVVVKMWDRMAQ
jgi:hypothetical protein